jgi:HD domain
MQQKAEDARTPGGRWSFSRTAMDENSKAPITRYLPHVVVATAVVAVFPTAAVWGLRSLDVVHSAVVLVALAVALSLGASYAACAFWSSRSDSGDLLFGELMVWGWLRRLWIERRLASALRLLGVVDASAKLSRERRAQLLAQLATLLESRDPYTHGHSRRVARYAEMIAGRMGLSRRDVAKVRDAAAVHDVGKLNVPAAILQKAGPLTDAEFDVIKLHPIDGSELVSKLGDPELTAIVRHHHERLDGTGYPDSVAGDEIPLGARIIAVADTFDAITSMRPYRPASTHKTALHVLVNEAGRQLDPAAVRAFRGYYSGRRPFALWVILTNLPGRLPAWMTGSANAAAANSVARVMAVATATSVVAATAVIPQLVAHRPATDLRPPAPITSSAYRRSAQQLPTHAPALSGKSPSAGSTATGHAVSGARASKQRSGGGHGIHPRDSRGHVSNGRQGGLPHGRQSAPGPSQVAAGNAHGSPGAGRGGQTHAPSNSQGHGSGGAQGSAPGRVNDQPRVAFRARAQVAARAGAQARVAARVQVAPRGQGQARVAARVQVAPRGAGPGSGGASGGDHGQGVGHGSGGGHNAAERP